MSVIAERFGLPTEPATVKCVDTEILYAEREALCGPAPQPWELEGSVRASVGFHCWRPEVAEMEFLTRFYELQGK